jgi:hypothetical protein
MRLRPYTLALALWQAGWGDRKVCRFSLGAGSPAPPSGLPPSSGDGVVSLQ